MIRPGIRTLFDLALRRRNVAREVDTELRTHIELRTEQLTRAGWSQADAHAENIVRLVVGNGLILAATGVVAGCVMAIAGARFIQPLLFDTSAKDPRVFAIVSVALLTVAFAATIIPAVRARGVNPADAMRTE